MKQQLYITVEEVLQRPLFSSTKVVAGEKGLSRQVNWVHIHEIPYFDETVFQGGELILSTGVGFQWKKSSYSTFLLNLISHEASALCVELGHYFKEVPDKMIKLANDYDFPIIVFNHFVNFVEITQDLHSIIINSHHSKLISLDDMSKRLQTFSLEPNSIFKMLNLLNKQTNAQVIYLPVGDKPSSFPQAEEEQIEFLINYIDENKKTLHDTDNMPVKFTAFNRIILLQQVGALNQTWGHLFMVLKYEPDKFDFLIIDRVSLNISQVLLRRHYLNEKQLRLEAKWLNDLIYNRITEEGHARRFLSPQLKQLHSFFYYIVAIDVRRLAQQFSSGLSDEESGFSFYHYSSKIRSEFTKNSFIPYITSINNQIIVLSIDLGKSDSTKKRILDIASILMDYTLDTYTNINIGISRQHRSLLEVHRGHQEANIALDYKKISLSPLYENLGVYRFLRLIQQDQEINNFIEDYLQPIIDYDNEYNTIMLETLRTYFEYERSKKHTSGHLNIVRQTLYYRLEKIKEILDFDFDQPEYRLNVEMALKAFHLLQSKR